MPFADVKEKKKKESTADKGKEKKINDTIQQIEKKRFSNEFCISTQSRNDSILIFYVLHNEL